MREQILSPVFCTEVHLASRRSTPEIMPGGGGGGVGKAPGGGGGDGIITRQKKRKT